MKISAALKSKARLGLLLLLCSSATFAEALVSSPLYVRQGPVGGTVICRIFQFSSSFGEPIGATAIYANNSTTPVPLSFNSCNAQAGVKQNQNCSYGATIAGNLSYTCVFVSGGGSGAHYTGTIEIQDASNNVLARESMRAL
jgi:hypothetical protein